MRLRQIIIVILGLLLAGGAALFARTLFSPPSAPVAEAPLQDKPVREVLVARTGVSLGAFIRPDEVVWQTWPEGMPIEFYYSRADAKPEDLAGAMARRSFSAGEPITRSDVIRAGDSGFLAAVLRPGYRAISIKVDAASSTAGLIAPGDLVDVILTNRVNDAASSNNSRLVSQTILTSARVLAMDQRLSDRPTDDKQAQAAGARAIPDTVTMEVSPKDAERMAVAVRLGDLTLSLRSFAKNAAKPGATPADGAATPVADATTPVAADLVTTQTAAVPAIPDMKQVTFDSEVSTALRPQGGAPSGLTVLRGSAKPESAAK